MIEEERPSGFVSNELRVILMGRDVELRVISLIVRCRSVADEVIFLDLGSNDETVELASEVDCPVLNYDGEFETAKIVKFLHNSNLEEIATTLLIHITSSWKLSDLPLTVNRARDNWDLHIAVKGTSKESINTEEQAQAKYAKTVKALEAKLSEQEQPFHDAFTLEFRTGNNKQDEAEEEFKKAIAKFKETMEYWKQERLKAAELRDDYIEPFLKKNEMEHVAAKNTLEMHLRAIKRRRLRV